MARQILGKVVPEKGVDYFTEEDIKSLNIPKTYDDLENRPIIYLEGTEKSPIVLRDLEHGGLYIMTGVCTPYANSNVYMQAQKVFTLVSKNTETTYLQLLFPYANQIQYITATDNSYDMKQVMLNDLITNNTEGLVNYYNKTEIDTLLEDTQNILILDRNDTSDEAKLKAQKIINKNVGKEIYGIVNNGEERFQFDGVMLSGVVDTTKTFVALEYNSVTDYSNKNNYRLTISGSWSEDVFTVNSISYMTNLSSKLALTTTNTTEYTPTEDYNPSTKKYVDDSIATAIGTALEGEY